MCISYRKEVVGWKESLLMYLFFPQRVRMGLANAVQSRAAGLQAGRLEGRPATPTPASFVWTRAVSACRSAHDEVSVGNCPHEASTSQGVMVGGERVGEARS